MNNFIGFLILVLCITVLWENVESFGKSFFITHIDEWEYSLEIMQLSRATMKSTSMRTSVLYMYMNMCMFNFRCWILKAHVYFGIDLSRVKSFCLYIWGRAGGQRGMWRVSCCIKPCRVRVFGLGHAVE